MSDERVGVYRDGDSWVVFTAPGPVGDKHVVVSQPVEAISIARQWEPGDTVEDTWEKREVAGKRLVALIEDEERAYEDELRDTKAELARLRESYAKMVARMAKMAAQQVAAQTEEE